MKQALYVWVILMSLITFIMFGIDKRKARKHAWRISETTLIVLSLIGGGIGGFIGMKVFHHKTRKMKFTIVTISAIVWLLAVFACILNVV
ncbi:MAG: DUF1294 domain-containing protein [Bulleidia sp.]